MTFTAFVQQVLPQLITLLALTVATVVAAILVAIRDKVFEWNKIADFLRVIVVPMIGGWLLLEALRYAVLPGTIPKDVGWADDALEGFALFAYGAVFIAISARLFAHLNTLGVVPDLKQIFNSTKRSFTPKE